MKFRKKPVVIEAMQLKEPLDIDSRLRMEDWIESNRRSDLKNFRYRGSDLIIKTLEGEMLANVGDWIIRGVNGEYYPCKPDIFDKTYEPVQ
jgi:hypothetical protein